MHKACKQQNEEDKILFYLLQNRPNKPFVGPISIEIRCFIERPKSHYGTGKNDNKLKDKVPEWHTNTPDLDNFVKMILDCMNGIFFVDDRQVFSIHAFKKYTNSKRPRWEISLKEEKNN